MGYFYLQHITLVFQQFIGSEHGSEVSVIDVDVLLQGSGDRVVQEADGGVSEGGLGSNFLAICTIDIVVDILWFHLHYHGRRRRHAFLRLSGHGAHCHGYTQDSQPVKYVLLTQCMTSSFLKAKTYSRGITCSPAQTQSTHWGTTMLAVLYQMYLLDNYH